MPPRLATYRDILDNGLRVVTVELPHLHTATITFYAKVGSRFERPATNGLSHFVEHMLFRGTEHYPSSYDINFAVEDLGSMLYAETGRDYSLYQMALGTADVERGVELFGEIFGSPRFADLELERRLILEEINEDYDEHGAEINGDDIVRGLMFRDHPLGQRIIGPRTNVERFSEADVRSHFAEFYGASNLLLCVTGPVAHTDVMASAQRHVASLPAGQQAVETTPSFDQKAPLYRYVPDTGSQTSISLLARAVPEHDPDYVACIALLRALDDGMSTRLHYRLCDQLGLAYSIQAGLEPLHDVSLFEVNGATAHAKVVDLITTLLTLLGELRDELITDAELAKIKRRYHYELDDSTDDASAMSAWFGGTTLYYLPSTLEQRAAQMNSVTAEDIRRVASRILRPDRLAVTVVGTLTKARQADVRSAIGAWT